MRTVVLAVKGRTARRIFGPVDEAKFRSSLTLFRSPPPRRQCSLECLETYFAGESRSGDACKTRALSPKLASAMTSAPPVFSQRHLLGIEHLDRLEIEALLDLADEAVAISRQVEKKRATLRGRTQINLFFEASTRTQSSFELAGKRLGADVMNMAVGASSVKKGETLIDTAMTLNAMRPDILVVRHHAAGAVSLLARKVDCSVINAGDGAHEHPTQALLDALTIRRNLGRIEGLTVAICGDILHSRVARSNILLLGKLGARVRVVGPSTLLPAGVEAMGVEVFRDMRAGLAGRRHRDDAAPSARADGRRLRAQHEGVFPLFRPRSGKAVCAKPGALVMHPGPMNRGVEIDTAVADGAQSPDPRAGRDGRRRAHGRFAGAGAQFAERLTAARPAGLTQRPALWRIYEKARTNADCCGPAAPASAGTPSEATAFGEATA